jgi:hypothetical protein
VSTLTDESIDALFAPKQHGLFRAPGRITCRVCEKSDQADDARPLLCTYCARDLERARAHVAELLTAAQRTAEEAYNKLELALPDDGPLAERWASFQVAHARQDVAAQLAMHKARQGMAGPLADLIRLWNALQDAQAQLKEREDWARRADLALVLNEDEGTL